MKNRIIIFLILIAFSVSCTHKEEFEIVNLNNNRITILGHGGLGVGVAQYPMNSFEAIVSALSMGADGSEMDIQITKDSVLVAFHDQYLEQASDGNGEIYTKTWNEIKDVNYSKSAYTTYKVASLESIFSRINATGYVFTFDTKFNNPDKSTTNRDIFQRAIIRLIDKYHIERNVTIEAPEYDFVKSLKEKRPDLNIFIYSDFDNALEIANELNLKGITVKAGDVSADQVREAHNNGKMVAVFSTTQRNHVETIKKNVDIIQTDALKDLIYLLK